jgi:hypothetical protein
VVVESLRNAPVVWPRFGHFEMWVLADGGRLAVGRSPGRALWVDPEGVQSTAEFSATAARRRTEAPSGFKLPSGWWQGVGPAWSRVDGALSRGRAPDGGPAVYDISLARGGASRVALVFHLQDAPFGIPASRGKRRGLPAEGATP